MLILSIIPNGLAPTEVPLFQVPFWVQVHNIPTGFMSGGLGKHVGNTFGSFLEYDVRNMFEFGDRLCELSDFGHEKTSDEDIEASKTWRRG